MIISFLSLPNLLPNLLGPLPNSPPLRWTPFFGQLGASDKVELGGWPRDRVVLIGCWTASIFIGSVLKDRRLARSLGEDDRASQARVPGYPGIPFGPLARLP